MEQLLNTWAVREVVRPVLDVLMLAYLLYKSWQILVQTRAVQLIKGTVVMVLIYAVSFFLQLTTLLWILNVLVPGLVIAIAIVFQPELRKIFTQIGSREWFRLAPRGAARAGAPRVEILLSAVQQLSARRRGALIVIPRRVGIRNIIQTGTRLNADISLNLVSTIFFEGTALHDGAMVVEGDRIVAAGCFLPLSEREDVESTFGARHRAALGMVEETDAVVLVVSEETGAVSLARDGDIRYNISIADMEAELNGAFAAAGAPAAEEGT
ncbi:MAG TPA: diadenylate cyclase CdaA [Spirochaetia bacterium]|nr:diadenylate cyclase CdaA [Spirochaetia bacterium]